MQRNLITCLSQILDWLAHSIHKSITSDVCGTRTQFKLNCNILFYKHNIPGTIFFNFIFGGCRFSPADPPPPPFPFCYLTAFIQIITNCICHFQQKSVHIYTKHRRCKLGHLYEASKNIPLLKNMNVYIIHMYQSTQS